VKKLPIYEYRCKQCERVFDILQKLNSDPVKECVHCSGPVEKLISASSFQLKGSGWYATDYKKSAQEKVIDKKPESSENVSGLEKKDNVGQKNVA